MTLTEFLLARIAEDERGALTEPPMVRADSDFVQTWRPPRVMSECKVKRRMVERWRWAADNPSWAGDMELDWDDAYATLTDLAAIYSDHDDYDESWRP